MLSDIMQVEGLLSMVSDREIKSRDDKVGYNSVFCADRMHEQKVTPYCKTALFLSLSSATMAVYLVEAATTGSAAYAGGVHSFNADNTSTTVARCRKQLRTGCVPTHFCPGVWLPCKSLQLRPM